MTSKLFLSDNYLVNNYFRLLHLFLSHNKKTLSSIKTTIKLKLSTKKSLLRFYKKVSCSGTLSNTLISYIALSYCLLKHYIVIHFHWLLSVGFNVHFILFFVYHFLYLYQLFFGLRMVIDWFPIKNWERASPVIRFIRRSTDGWMKPFEDYIPSIFAWLVAVNLVPIFMKFIRIFCASATLANFPTSYNFLEMHELVIESNLLTLQKRNILWAICLWIWQNIIKNTGTFGMGIFEYKILRPIIISICEDLDNWLIHPVRPVEQHFCVFFAPPAPPLRPL